MIAAVKEDIREYMVQMDDQVDNISQARDSIKGGDMNRSVGSMRTLNMGIDRTTKKEPALSKTQKDAKLKDKKNCDPTCKLI